MPHLSIEYSGGSDADGAIASLCRVTHEAMVQAGIFPVAGIRVRAHRADHCIVADGLDENDFVAMTLAVAAGRTPEALKSAGDDIFRAAQQVFADRLSTPHFALSLEIREMSPTLSWKDTPIHARLSKKD